MFLHVSVILFTGGSASVHAGIHRPWDETPPRSRPPPGPDPPEQCMLGDTGNKRSVRILLECILVYSLPVHIRTIYKMSVGSCLQLSFLKLIKTSHWYSIIISGHEVNNFCQASGPHVNLNSTLNLHFRTVNKIRNSTKIEISHF